MTTIVVAYFSYFDGEVLQQVFTEFDSGLEAMNTYLGLDTHYNTEEEVYEYCTNSDSVISYIVVD
jgi:hypothetical protein